MGSEMCIRDRSYDKTQEEIDSVYDEIERLETLITQTKRKLESVEQGTKAIKQVENLIRNIPALIKEMTCGERRKLYQLLIDKIEMYSEETSDGRIIKSISFKFPVFYEDWEPTKVSAKYSCGFSNLLDSSIIVNER